MSRRQHSHQVTVREGTSEKYWYTLVGYLVAFGLIALYVVYSVFALSQNPTSGGVMAGGILIAIGILILFVLGLGVYPALFKDSAYVRGSGYRWKPKWWYHLTGGLGVPLLIGAIFGVVGVESGPVVGVMVFPLSTAAVATHYLYQRHKHIGVP